MASIEQKEPKPGFRHNNDLHTIHNDLLKAAELAEVRAAPELLWKNLSAYGDFYSGSAVTFKTTTKPKTERGLTVRYVELKVPHDPYSIALSQGVLKQQDHPIYDLYHEIRDKYPMLGYGVDVDVRDGLAKIWTFIQIPQPISEALNLPSLPKGIKDNLDYFNSNKLSDFSLFALDYLDKTVNIYFMMDKPDIYSPDDVAEMIGQLGFEVPSQEVLEHCTKAVTIYYTFSWTSNKIERLCFGMSAPNPDAVPTHLHPLVERYTKHAPMLADRRAFIYSMTFTKDGLYIKIENDYSGSMIELMEMGGAAPAMLDELKKRVDPEVVRSSEKQRELDWEPEIVVLYDNIIADVPEVFRPMVKILLMETAEKKCYTRAGECVNEPDLITALFEITPDAFKADSIANLKSLGVDVQKYLKSE